MRGLACGVLLVSLLACRSPVTFRDFPELVPGSGAFFATLAAHTDARFLTGNRVEILLNGDGTFPQLLAAIRSARRTIAVEQYIYDTGPIAEELTAALAERCRAGVKAHLLLDSFGSNGLPRESAATLTEAGCELEWFGAPELVQLLPPWRLLSLNNRNHQRIVVVDGEIGFTGGFGVSASWMGDGREGDHWRETNVRFEGPAVQQLQAAFVQDWREATGVALGGADYFPPLLPKGDVTAQVVKSSPTSGASASYMFYLFAITTARRSIQLTNPYFVVDAEMERALADAVARGVEVSLLIPGRVGYQLLGMETSLVQHAGRSGLGALLRAGVRVYEYRPARLHAKTMVVDDVWATVGSTNLDPRSFALNKELNLTVYDPRVAARLAEIFRTDLALSDPLDYAAWRSRGLADRLLELFAYPAKSQL
jgi:cardiolipin synthase A/B